MPRCCMRMRAWAVRLAVIASLLFQCEACQVNKAAIDGKRATGDPVATQPDVFALAERREALTRGGSDGLEKTTSLVLRRCRRYTARGFHRVERVAANEPLEVVGKRRWRVEQLHTDRLSIDGNNGAALAWFRTKCGRIRVETRGGLLVNVGHRERWRIDAIRGRLAGNGCPHLGLVRSPLAIHHERFRDLAHFRCPRLCEQRPAHRPKIPTAVDPTALLHA